MIKSESIAESTVEPPVEPPAEPPVPGLALAFASTIRHDGHGGVADDLADPAALPGWAAGVGFDGVPGSAEAQAAVLSIRAGTRALFAYAVRPWPASRADAHRLLPLAEAVDRINTAAAQVPVTVRLDWDDERPASVLEGGAADPVVALTAALARATIAFLAGPDRENLRACQAPRCVRYFVKGHGRQEFCKPSCSNRARVARHYARHQAEGQVDE
ncbi:CGNR zinc finger domain-containing protein [Hamadaea tsunoensis]|uniref:CGNR zinc finger domain-containing protein n=1 Tax=Hamadaea tsunoensis TaxID=53368 RepID=UPI0003F8445A|nr:CGNR zinc finger domain-containing protein [Hamadaea tsunoensis]